MENNQDDDFNDKKSTNIDSITVNRAPVLDNELEKQKYVKDSIGEGTILRFNQTLQKYLKVSVGNDTYNLTKHNETQIIDTTFIRSSSTSGYVLPLWKLYSSDKNGSGKISNFVKATRSSSSTTHSGATSLPAVGDGFLIFETSSNNHGNIVYVRFERTDIIQITNITFYFNRFSILTNGSLKSTGRFRIQLLLEDKTWSTRYNIAKNDRYSDSSTDWTLVSLNFTEEMYGIKLIYDQIDTAHADICFSNITITHSVY